MAPAKSGETVTAFDDSGFKLSVPSGALILVLFDPVLYVMDFFGVALV